MPDPLDVMEQRYRLIPNTLRENVSLRYKKAKKVANTTSVQVKRVSDDPELTLIPILPALTTDFNVSSR